MADEGVSCPLYIIDAFTDKSFSGNPAAICLVGPQALTDDVCQKIAKEMNLSETAFVIQKSEDDTHAKGSCFGLRWFTPTCEVALCGHATLASAAVLFYVLGNSNKEITFETLSGNLMARREDTYICLNFPLYQAKPMAENDAALDKLIKTVTSGLPVKDVRHSADTKKLLVCLDESVTRESLESLCVDTQALMAIYNKESVRGVIVTLQGGPPYDFLSRYFAPWYGIPEDPVTARQCSARGGDLKISLRDDGRVDIAGQAAVVLEGKIRV